MDDSKDYWEFSKPNPTLREFHQDYLRYAEDVGYHEDRMTGRHTLNTKVTVRVDGDSEVEFDLVGLAIDRLGCGCECGIELVVRPRG